MSAEEMSTDRDRPVFDAQPWPDKLTARVVMVGPRPRIAGYDVEADLAPNYPFSATILLALTGELPTDEATRAFDVALQFLAPVPVNEAPTHAAVLARICTGEPRSIVGVAAVALAEQAAWTVQEHDAWLAYLDNGGNAAPDARWLATNEDDRVSTARLRDALAATGLRVAALAHDLARIPALLATLHACGLRRADQIERAWVMARLPAALAEAFATAPRSFRDYPFNLPRFVYKERP